MCKVGIWDCKFLAEALFGEAECLARFGMRLEILLFFFSRSGLCSKRQADTK